MVKKITEVTSATILFAGDSGDGMQLTGTEFTNTVAQTGNDVSTLPDFPAEIRAPGGTVSGVSGFKVHFGSIEINSPGDLCDILVVMNAAALKKSLLSIKENGIIIANTDGFDAKNIRLANCEENPLERLQDSYTIYQIDISKQTQLALKDFEMSTKDKDRSKNMFALGFVYWLYSKPMDFTTQFVSQKFKGKKILVEANITVLKAGYNYGEITETITEKYTISKAEMPKGTYRNITGNQAIALGFVAAAQKAGKQLYYGGYPITPASDILHNLAKYRSFNVKTFQAEDEIAAMTSIIGASFAGALAITASSGPGIALKTEAMGLGVIQELPMVIINVQRGGPSTGLPTKTEQADLLQAVYGRNGEAPIPVLAAKSPADCFYKAYEAAKIALEHNTPVILLSDGYLANGSEPWNFPTIEELPEIHVAKAQKLYEEETYFPYQRNEHGVRSVAYLGMKGFEHVLGGLEKDELTGNVSYDGDNHEIMTKKRQEKIDFIAYKYPKTQLNYGNESAKTLIISWGSPYGSIRTAMRTFMEEHKSVAFLHLEHIYPLPNDLQEFTNNFETIIVPELNNKQLLHLLQSELKRELVPYNKIQGMPFTSNEIYDFVSQYL